jgi:flagellar FliL protein
MAKHSDTDGEAKAKSKSPLMLIGVAVFALILGGGAAWFFVGHKSDSRAEVKAKHTSAPVFITLEPFVVNLAGDTQRFLQVGIDLRIIDPHVSDQIKVHLPEIRNGVLLLLSSKSAEDLNGVEQKNRLREEIRAAVNKPIGVDTPAPKPRDDAPKPEGTGEAQAAEPPPNEDPKGHDPDAGVVEVLLTSFVIQ